mmetsp:Transcript_54908/g.80557  ORF Transcript_54908/g.80557 Transcript_54908/m.80557 type:complete len:309 (+) Transcript_54908:98-1024(+)
MEGLECLLDDAARGVDVSLVRNKRGGKADDVVVGGLGEEAVLGKLQAHIPGSDGPAANLGRLDNDGVEQALTTHQRDQRRVHGGEVSASEFTHLLGVLAQLLFLDHLERGHGDLARKGVASKGRAVLSGLDAKNHLVRAQNSRHGKGTARQRLAQNNQVGLDVVVIHGEQLPGTRAASLYLVSNEEHVVLLADLLCLLHVARVGHHHSGLALDWLHHEGAVVGVAAKGLVERGKVVEGNEVEARHHGTKITIRVWVRRRRDRRQCTPPEVLVGKEDTNIVVLHTLHPDTPTTSELAGRFTALHSGVHW